MENRGFIEDKSFRFAVRIVNLHKHLTKYKAPVPLTSQILRSGTSVGANVTEAQDAQSKKDFVAKLSIALKEARETKYWMRILIETSYLDKDDKNVASLLSDLEELLRLLVAIIKTSKAK